MRISDWSSDVCSSDLDLADARASADRKERRSARLSGAGGCADQPDLQLAARGGALRARAEGVGIARQRPAPAFRAHAQRRSGADDLRAARPRLRSPAQTALAPARSEEHTSELPSLMR